MRVWIVLAVFVTFLGARENPFIPAVTQDADAQQVQTTTLSPADERAAEPSPGPDVVNVERPVEKIDFKTIRFDVRSDRISIVTKDKLKKHFMVKAPTRIILNFNSSGNFPTQRQTVGTAGVKEIRMGAHKGYYSVVIELEKMSDYKIVPAPDGYTLILR
jgi:hypothetical protein